MFLKVQEDLYVFQFCIDSCCSPEVNGENRLLAKILEKSKSNSVIFDVGARNSVFPNFSNTHEFHLFDPKFVHEPGVDYSKCKLVEVDLNSTGFTIDKYCERNKITEIEFLKIDTDGYDLDVLKGATHMINHSKYIQIEHDITWLYNKVSASDVMKIMKDFVLYKITPLGLVKVDKIKEDYVYANYLFTNEDISYDPHVMDLPYFKKLFYQHDPDKIDEVYEKREFPFSSKNYENKQLLLDILTRYYNGYVHEFTKKYLETGKFV